MKSKALNGLAYGEEDGGVFEKEGGGYVKIERGGWMPNPLEEWDTAATYLTWERRSASPQRNAYRGPEELYEELTGESGDGLDLEEMAEGIAARGHVCEPIYRNEAGIGLSDAPMASSIPWPVGLAFVPAGEIARQGIDREELSDAMEAEMASYSAWAVGDIWETTEYGEDGAPTLEGAVFYGLSSVAQAYPGLEKASPEKAAEIEGRPYIDPRGAVVLGTFPGEDAEKPFAVLFAAGAREPFVAAAGYDAKTGEYEPLGSYSDPMRAWAKADPQLIEPSLSVWSRGDVKWAVERSGARADPAAVDAVIERADGGAALRMDASASGRVHIERIAESLPRSERLRRTLLSLGTTHDREGAWRDACAMFKADPRTLESWYEDVVAAFKAAAGDPPCWGDAWIVSDLGGYIPSDTVDKLLPDYEQYALFHAMNELRYWERFQTPPLPFDVIVNNCENVAAAAGFSRLPKPDEVIFFAGNITPECYELEKLDELAKSRPDLFDEESCAKWPELADVKKAAALEATFAAAEPSSKAVNAERLEARGDDEKDAPGRGGHDEI